MTSSRITTLFALLLALPPVALAATWYVDGVNGNDSNNCKSATTACKTIGHAISLASSGNSIKVAAATYPENLTINISLKIIGDGATTTIIDGGGVDTVVTVSASATNVVLSNFTVRNGKSGQAGGILNKGTMTVSYSTLTANHATGCSFPKICFADYSGGGGIFNGGVLTINNSTISGNFASDGQCEQYCSSGGGGINNQGTLMTNNSTISANSVTAGCFNYCSSYGGGIFNHGTVTISNSTLDGNAASATCRLLPCGALGGGIYSSTKKVATLQNSFVADSPFPLGNCSGTLTSDGYNLSSDGSCNFNGRGDLNNTEPMLGPLQDNGGPTQTQALLSGSPAIDAGNPSGCTDAKGHLLTTDQRGQPRPDKEDSAGCDMGAYESQSD